MPPQFHVEAPRCARCNDRVYAAEQVVGPSAKIYHKPCLKCIVCNKLLDSVSLLEHDGEPFCHHCHRTHLGQGKGGFGTAVPLRPKIDTPPKQIDQAQKSHTNFSTTISPSKQTTPSSERGRLPITPTGSTEPLSLPSSLSWKSLGRKSSEALQSEPRKGEVIPTNLSSPSAPIIGGTPLCRRCQKPVYFAEQKQAAGHKWHRPCLRCDGCSASLDSGKVQDGPVELSEQGWANTWCRMCYAKQCSSAYRTTDFPDVTWLVCGEARSQTDLIVIAVNCLAHKPKTAANFEMCHNSFLSHARPRDRRGEQHFQANHQNVICSYRKLSDHVINSARCRGKSYCQAFTRTGYNRLRGLRRNLLPVYTIARDIDGIKLVQTL